MARLNIVLYEFLSAFKWAVKEAQALVPRDLKKQQGGRPPCWKIDAASATDVAERKENQTHTWAPADPPTSDHDGCEEPPPVRGGGGGQTRFNQCRRCE